jgi:hypothetical protein
MVSRYVPIVERWHTLTPERDRCLEYAVRALCVREAMRHTSDASVLAVCERVALLCEAVAAGGAIDAPAFATTAKAARAARAAREAASAARAAEEAAAWAALAAAAASAAEEAAWAAAAAEEAAEAAEAAEEAAAAASAAEEAAADRLTDAILGACERELGIAKEAL